MKEQDVNIVASICPSENIKDMSSSFIGDKLKMSITCFSENGIDIQKLNNLIPKIRKLVAKEVTK